MTEALEIRNKRSPFLKVQYFRNKRRTTCIVYDFGVPILVGQVSRYYKDKENHKGSFSDMVPKEYKFTFSKVCKNDAEAIQLAAQLGEDISDSVHIFRTVDDLPVCEVTMFGNIIYSRRS